MFLISSLLFFLYSFFLCKKKSIAYYLSLFIGFSFILAFISPLSQQVATLKEFANLVFMISALLVIVHAFRPYYVKSLNFPAEEPTFFWLFVYLLVFMLSLAFILNIFIVYKSIGFVFLESANITNFKNEGLANELIRQWVNPRLVTFVNLLSPMGYVAIGLHFYFLLKKNVFYSFVFLILALNLPLSSLHGLSRSGLVHFSLIYVFMFFYIRPSLNASQKKIFSRFGFTFLLIFLIFFIFISGSRFGEGSYHSRYSDLGSFWEGKTILLSTLDYGSQWVTNSLVVLNEYSPDKLWLGKSSFKVFEIGAGLIGLDYQSYADVRQLTLGEYASKFLGLIAVLVYDFGYIGTILVLIVFFTLIRYFSPKKNEVSKKSIIYFPILIAVPVMFFTNNYLSNASLSIGIIFLVISAFLLHLNYRRYA